MFKSIVSIVFCVALLSSCDQKEQNAQPNILLICIDDLRPELKSFGAKHIISPHIDGLAEKGVSFTRHYVNAPSCGPSRYTLLTGKYGPPDNDALFNRAEKLQQGEKHIDPSMPEWFRAHGYTTVSVGKVSHHPGGRGGMDWNDDAEIEMPGAWDRHLQPAGKWEHPRGIMHGLSHGETRNDPKSMPVYQHTEGNDMIYPDGLITGEAVSQLRTLTKDEKPFFLAVGIIKPHLPFGAPKSYYDLYQDVDFPAILHPGKPKNKTTWHPSGEFMKYNLWGKDPNSDKAFSDEVRRHYAACVSYADAQVGKLLTELKRMGADKNTIIVLWGDHGWHLGEHTIWGKHSLFEESLRSPLIISSPGMEQPGLQTNAIVETSAIFPTLCDLSGLEVPEFSHSTSLKPMMGNKQPEGHAAYAYKPNASTLRTNTHRLILHKDGFIELYDHTSPQKETLNIAEQNPKVVQEILEMLNEREALRTAELH